MPQTRSQNPLTRIDAVLPAGGRLKPPFAQAPGVDIKALLPLEGQTVLRRTIQPLRETEGIGRIVVVGPEAALEEARAAGAEGALPEGETGPDNIFRGLEWLQAQEDLTDRVLIVTTDAPFLTPEAITRFLAACPTDADICIPLVERRPFEALYPGLIRTDTPLRDGYFRLGCLYLIDPQTLLRVRPHLEAMFAARKSNFQMARLIGFPFLFRYLLRRLSVEDIVARACELLQCRGVAVHDVPPELGFDIDLAEEYAYARAYAAGQIQPTAPVRATDPLKGKETAR
ncbi:MAG TPA: NTP transferase domain-containing protein [Chthonomonadaceae bacterium]|nr:NTP transferase domain-containing protein [Chthonomonadaceae bacterium]